MAVAVGAAGPARGPVMTHRHAFRRGVAPRPSAADIRSWRRLLKRAAPIGADPMQDAHRIHDLAFVVAAEKANKAIAPVGQQGWASPFVALVRMGMGFMKLNAVERMAAGERVRSLVEECRAVLDGDGPQLRMPYRED